MIRKFRAWNPRRAEMHQPCCVEFYPDGSFCAGSREMYPNYFEIDDRVTLMQFTGQKDISGMEIYEGDIIKTSHGATGIVIWIEGELRFGFDCTGNMWSHPIYGMGGDKKVIGNVYENPELTNKS